MPEAVFKAWINDTGEDAAQLVVAATDPMLLLLVLHNHLHHLGNHCVIRVDC